MDDTYTKYLSPLRFRGDCIEQNWVLSESSDTDITDILAYRLELETFKLKNELIPSCKSAEFIVQDLKNPTVFSAMFVGGVDTPYKNCLFKFLIHLPNRYPNDPARMRSEIIDLPEGCLLPNVLKRQVLLSLLGTFPTNNESMVWTKDTYLSTLIQSIKLLFLVSEPYFLTPMHQHEIDSPDGIHSSRIYNIQTQMISVAEGIVLMLDNPAPEFIDVINLHFLCKYDELLEQLTTWKKETDEVKMCIVDPSPDTFSYKNKSYTEWYDLAIDKLNKLKKQLSS